MKKTVKALIASFIGLSVLIAPQVAKAGADKESPEMNKVSYWVDYYEADGGIKYESFIGDPKTFKISDYQTAEEIASRDYVAIILKAGSINSNEGSAHEPILSPDVNKIYSFYNGKDLSHVILIWNVKPITPPPSTTTPSTTTPSTTTPSTTTPSTTTPPLTTTPSTTTPSTTTPSTTTPVETKPVETTPNTTTPMETKPVETKPVETTTPVSSTTTTVITKPVTTKPVTTKPVDNEGKPITELPNTGVFDNVVLPRVGAGLISLGVLTLFRKKKK